MLMVECNDKFNEGKKGNPVHMLFGNLVMIYVSLISNIFIYFLNIWFIIFVILFKYKDRMTIENLHIS